MNDRTFRRGDVVVSTFSGDYGKPRHGIVVQSDVFNPTHDSVVLCPVTSEITGFSLFRIALPQSGETGLRVESEVMVDKITVAKRRRIRQRIGKLSPEQLARVNDALRIWLDLPDGAG
jgi:mRNA interferase MazF